jgi:hypothetical protein
MGSILMSRARNIKPSFFKNEVLASCSPYARLVFIGLWGLADREGRLEDRPLRIKAEVLPYDNCDMEKLLSELSDAGFIVRYKKELPYIQVLNFIKHQNPHVKESASIIPAPDSNGASPADSLLLIPDSPIPHPVAALPDWLNTEAWAAWNKYRSECHKPLKPSTVTRQLKFLHEHLADHIAIIEQSIRNGWQGLFELKGDFNGSQKPRKLSAVERVREATDRREAERQRRARESGGRDLEADVIDLRPQVDKPIR